MSGLKHLLFQSEISNDKFPVCLKKHFLMVPLKIDLVCAFHKCWEFGNLFSHDGNQSFEANCGKWKSVIGADFAGNLSNSISPHQLLPSLRKWVKICRKSQLKVEKYFDQKLDIFISEMNYCKNTVWLWLHGSGLGNLTRLKHTLTAQCKSGLIDSISKYPLEQQSPIFKNVLSVSFAQHASN